jgi:hypothetical protein
MLILAISLVFNVYFYLQVINRQSIINNIRSEIIVEWANEMDVAAHYLKNATTNIDIAEQYGVRWFLLSAYHIMKTAYDQSDDWEFYEPFVIAPLDVAGNLIPYEKDAQVAPIVERRISSGAIEMFANLADRIWNVTSLIFKEAQDLAKQDGVDPKRRLEEKGILIDIVDGCLEISLYSYEIHEFNPKFQ